jgi:ATP-dependent helicase/DNAse subunit B
MPLTLITGPANSAKARAVLDGVRAALNRDPLLVVPTGEDVDRYRRELADDGLVIGPQVMTFGALLEVVAQRAGDRRRPLGDVARERVMSAVVVQTELTALGASASTPGFARAALGLVEELQVARVEPGRLTAALRAWAGEDAARLAYGEDIAALYRGYRAALDRLGRPDRERWALEALDALRETPRDWGATPVFFYGFDDLTPLQREAVDALAEGVGADVCVSLTFERGRAAFAGRARLVADLEPLAAHGRRIEMAPEDAFYAEGSRTALHALERRLFEDDEQPPVPAGEAVALLQAGGERAEAELVAAEALALLRAGVPAEEIAIVTRTLNDQAPLLERVLATFGVPFALRRSVPLGRLPLGGALIALVRCALLDGSAGDLLAYLRGPGVLRDPRSVDALERAVRRTGAETAEAAIDLWQHDAPYAVDRLRRAADRGPAAVCEALAEEAGRMVAQALVVAPSPEGAPSPPGVPNPPLLDAGGRELARAGRAARTALTELAALAQAAPALAPTPADLVDQLGGVEVHVGERPGRGRVTVCDPLALRARRVRALILCGLQEGAFPRPGTPEPFLSDHERRELARASGIVLPHREDPLADERYLFYAAVSRPEQRLVLSSRVADDDGDPAIASFFLDDVRAIVAAPAVARRPLGAIAWPAAPPTAREAARAAAAAAPPRPAPPIAPLQTEPVLRALRERPHWSPSALESWAGCPVKWFVERYLNLENLGPDSEPLRRGSIAHETLERTLRELCAQTGSAKVTPQSLPKARELLREALELAAARTPLSPSPERLAAGVRRLEADLERYLDAAARDGSAYEPRHIEVSFGFEPDETHADELEGDGVFLPAVELEAPDGPIALRGRIDRVDVDPSGTKLQVIDYKTGRANPGSRWLADNTYQAAIYLKAAADHLGLEPVGAFYQPLSANDARRRGLMVDDADPDLDAVPTDRKPADEVRATLDAVIALAAAAGAQARTGALEPRPETCSGRGCAYPGLCRCEAAA